MATRLPYALPRRPTVTTTLTTTSSFPFPDLQTTNTSHTPLSHTPSRHATLIKRPRRPYTFTQLVQQTDGSTYTMRTTSPLGMYKSTKDTFNHVLWQPSNSSLRNVEVDEAGRLAAFRGRFGRGWDIEKPVEAGSAEEGEAAAAATADKAEGAKAKAAAPAAGAPAADAADKTGAKEKAKEEESKPAAPQSDFGQGLSDLIYSYSAQQEPIKTKKAAPAPKPGKKK